MIAVEYNPALESVYRDLQLHPQQLAHAMNVRHHGLVTEGFDRMLCMHWFSDQLGLLVDAQITEATRTALPTRLLSAKRICSAWLEDRKTRRHLPRLTAWLQRHAFGERLNIRIHKVKPNIAMWLGPTMPCGTLTRTSTVSEVLEVAARSFGTQVECSSATGPRYIYSGQWDGQPPRLVSGKPGSTCFLAGTFYRAAEACELVWSIDYSQYLEWYRRNLQSLVTAISRPTSIDMILSQEAVLEDLLGVDWLEAELARNSQHPACARLRVCRTFRERGGAVRYPSERDLAFAFLDMFADNYSIVECTKGNRHAITLGAMTNYGDERVRRRMRSELLVAERFGDVLLELNCAAWHLRQGHDVVATEDEGKPDLFVRIPKLTLPVQAECKHVSGKGKGTIKRQLSDANTKLRSVGVVEGNPSAYGVVYLDVSNRVGPIEDSGNEVPEAIAASVGDIRSILRGKNRSISAVWVMWKSRVASADQSGARLLTTWRIEVVRHDAPFSVLPQELSQLSVSTTTLLGVQNDALAIVGVKQN